MTYRLNRTDGLCAKPDVDVAVESYTTKRIKHCNHQANNNNFKHLSQLRNTIDLMFIPFAHFR
jgi:hypothetical protein